MNETANQHVSEVTGRENSSREWVQAGWYALVLCLVVLILIILSSDLAPQWIYQGF